MHLRFILGCLVLFYDVSRKQLLAPDSTPSPTIVTSPARAVTLTCLALIHTAAEAGYKFDPGMFDNPVQVVFDLQVSRFDRPNKTFHLEDLGTHDTVDLNGSLSRNDFYFGDHLHFDARIWASVAEMLGRLMMEGSSLLRSRWRLRHVLRGRRMLWQFIQSLMLLRLNK